MKKSSIAHVASGLIAIMLMCSCAESVGKQVVSTSGREIMVNGASYLIRGMCYHPVPKGSVERNFETLAQDLALMNELGVNTLRVYAPIDDVEVLDQIHAAGLKVIMGIGYNQGTNDIVSGTFEGYIEKYKGHEAILMWELGNEYNYHPEWFDGDIMTWYQALNTAAGRIHKLDPARPVTTAHGDLPDDMALSACPNVDVWGLNVYRWDDPSELFKEWPRVSDKPMYLSEAGADSFMTIARDGFKKGENEKAQAAATENILDAVFDERDICSGVAVFSFTDGWWKAGNPEVQDQGGSAPNSSGVPYDGAPNEEYWGIVGLDRNKKAAFDVVKEKFLAVAGEERE